MVSLAVVGITSVEVREALGTAVTANVKTPLVFSYPVVVVSRLCDPSPITQPPVLWLS